MTHIDNIAVMYVKALSEAQSLAEIKQADWDYLDDQTLSITEHPITFLAFNRWLEIEDIAAGLDQASISQIAVEWQMLIQAAIEDRLFLTRDQSA